MKVCKAEEMWDRDADEEVKHVQTLRTHAYSCMLMMVWQGRDREAQMDEGLHNAGGCLGKQHFR